MDEKWVKLRKKTGSHLSGEHLRREKGGLTAVVRQQQARGALSPHRHSGSSINKVFNFGPTPLLHSLGFRIFRERTGEQIFLRRVESE